MTNLNLYETKSVYDAVQGKWIEHFFINQKEVDGDEYFFRQDREPKIQDELLDEMIESDLDSCDECSLFDPEEELCTCDDDCGECELDA